MKYIVFHPPCKHLSEAEFAKNMIIEEGKSLFNTKLGSGTELCCVSILTIVILKDNKNTRHLLCLVSLQLPEEETELFCIF